MIQGPNVKRLIIEKMSYDAIPAGGGLSAGIAFLSSKEKISQVCKAATQWVENAILAVKSSPDNPYKTDEEIAGAILLKLEEREKANREKWKNDRLNKDV